MTIDMRSGISAALFSLVLGGCSFNDASRVEADFGNSVRQMVEEQIYDKQAASNPSEEVMAIDGVILDNSMKVYRGEAEKEKAAEKKLSVAF